MQRRPSSFPALIRQARDAGEEVVITEGDQPIAKLVPLKVQGPCFGSARGLVHMAEEFDAPLDDFVDYR